MSRRLHLPPQWPADLLEAIVVNIDALGDALLDRAGAETALPRLRLVGERARTTGQLKMFAGIIREGSWVDAVIDTADQTRAPLPKPDLRRMLRPRGPVAVFGASNFPFAFGAVGGDTASGLAAGNPVIVKGHPSHPGTSELFAAAVLRALETLKLPVGLFALLQGKSHELSGALVRHPSVSSPSVLPASFKPNGRLLFDIAAAASSSPIPDSMPEMGSLNPLIILPDALANRAEKIAQDVSGSVLLGGGQFCTKPGLILTLGDPAQFIAALTRSIAAAPAVTMLNQTLRDSFIARTSHWPGLAGVKTLVTTKAQEHAGVSPGLFVTNADSFVHQSDLREEAFGPATLVVQCDDMLDIQNCLGSIGGSLTGTVHLDAADDAPTILQALEGHVGRLIVNGYPTGVEVNNAIVHGGPYPATTDSGTTSVGSAAMKRFVRMIAYQDMPDPLLPPALQNGNPLKLQRVVNGRRTDESIAS